ncbi:MAG TPA: hypothetical protein VM431_15815 [Phycisphaerae bacterium]|nr:hypothetical protein [Phycisphaerae bacterium]
MERVVLWAVAIMMAALALVAGCISVDVPDGPYVKLDGTSSQPTPKDRGQVAKMDRPALENEVLRLAADNDRLRQEVAGLKRRNKLLDEEKDRLEDRVDNLEDQVKDLRKR